MNGRGTWAIIGVACLAAACSDARDLVATGGADQVAGCTGCHGSAASPAPPASTKGSTSTADLAVGAHAAHLRDGPLRNAIACTECHAPVTDFTHIDGVARIAWGPLATAAGAAPVWNRTGPAPSCATTYCHGATVGGGSNKTPVWTQVDGTQSSCGTCHGLPPPPPHPASTDCGACHVGYTATTVERLHHIDGIVQVGGDGGLGCGSCHAIPPPPPHVASTTCGTCHTGYTATSVNPTLHQNGVVDVAFTSCTACHGAPPSTGQHQRSEHRGRSCGDCHPGYTSTAVNATLHVNGSNDVGNRITSWNPSTRTCTNACHGSETW